MKMRKVAVFAATAGVALALAACSSTTDPEPTSSASQAPADVSGDITFLTNRTDLKEDGTLDTYVADFNETYPNVNVTIEAITNYEDDVRTRMSTPDGYGDVLLIPAQTPANELGNFFEPLGTPEELGDTYRFVNEMKFDGQVYGLALGGNANGVLYNKAVFEAAGVTTVPATPDEFLAALQSVKDNTDATPYYTNYKDGWPLGGQWTANIDAITGNPDAQSQMALDPAPWTEGKDIYVIDSLLFDIVNKGLSEEDPLTTNWEQSKSDFGTGKIASMVLGSWSISQFQAAATAAGGDPADVGFMAFPATAADGKQYATIGGDWKIGINVNSKNKEAAKAWMDYLIHDSGFTASQGMVSAVKADALPDNLSSLTDASVELIENNPAPEGQEGLLNNVANESQVDIWGNIYRQQIVDLARGQASGDKASFFADLNTKWAAAVANLAP